MMSSTRLARLRRVPVNAAWLLPAALAVLAAAIVALNTLVLPATQPALVWGIPRPEPPSFVVGRGGPGEFQWKNQVHREIRQYMEGLEVANEPQRAFPREWQRARQLSQSSGGLVVAAPESGRGDVPTGRPVRLTPAVPDPGQPRPDPLQPAPFVGPPLETPPASVQPASFVTPLGLHRSGIAGAGLYSLSLISFTAVTALLALVLPVRFRVARDALLTGGALRPLAVGMLAYLLAALLCLFLVILVIGGPLASLALGALLLLAVAGLVTAALALGRLLIRRMGQTSPAPALELATGVLALYVAGVLPFLGWPLMLAASCAGLGSLIMTRFGSGEPWSLRPLE